MMAAGIYNDLTNKRFGRLLVVKRLPNRNKKTFWECLCNCGKITAVVGDSLTTKRIRDGHSVSTKSCGCLQKEHAIREGQKKRKPEQLSIKHDIFSAYKRRAKKKKLAFEISFDEFCFYLKEPCSYCNRYEVNLCVDKYTNQQLYYNGIDRKNSNLGYTSDNITVCCGQCNYMKLDYSEKEFLDQVERIYLTRIKNVRI